jgi:hypothetical protein
VKIRLFALRWWQIGLLAIAAIWQIGWMWALVRWAVTQPSGGVVNTVANGAAALTLFSTPPVILVAIVVATIGQADKPNSR